MSLKNSFVKKIVPKISSVEQRHDFNFRISDLFVFSHGFQSHVYLCAYIIKCAYIINLIVSMQSPILMTFKFSWCALLVLFPSHSQKVYYHKKTYCLYEIQISRFGTTSSLCLRRKRQNQQQITDKVFFCVIIDVVIL